MLSHKLAFLLALSLFSLSYKVPLEVAGSVWLTPIGCINCTLCECPCKPKPPPVSDYPLQEAPPLPFDGYPPPASDYPSDGEPPPPDYGNQGPPMPPVYGYPPPPLDSGYPSLGAPPPAVSTYASYGTPPQAVQGNCPPGPVQCFQHPPPHAIMYPPYDDNCAVSLARMLILSVAAMILHLVAPF